MDEEQWLLVRSSNDPKTQMAISYFSMASFHIVIQINR